MAHFDLHRVPVRPWPIFAMFKKLWETPFDRRATDIAARVSELRSLSEAELAARGLERSQILRYVLTGTAR